jgi:hypothetical protein
VTDTSGHFQFLGWQPPIGEVLFLLVLALFPWWRQWLSQTWNFLLDRISSLSSHLRARRIGALELKVKNLTDWDDRKIMVRFLRSISSLIVLIGLWIIVCISVAQNAILMNTLLIAEFFKIPDPSLLGIMQGAPGVSILTGTEILYIVNVFVVFLLIITTVSFMVGTFQEMDDFSDPPKAIQRLEEQISALRAKGT